MLDRSYAKGVRHIRYLTNEERADMTTTANVMFNREAIEAEVVTLQALVDSIKEKRGSQAKLLQEATDQALSDTVTFDLDSIPAPFNTHGSEDTFGAALVDIAVYVQELNTWADQLRNEAVTAILKANGATDNVEALKAQYDSKRQLVEAMLIVCNAQGIDVEGIVIPALRVGRPPGSTNTRKSGSKYGHFYRVVDGVRKDQSESQDTLSSFTYYHGAKLMQQDDRPSTAGVTAFLKTHGVDSPMGKAWSIESDGVTYGMEIVGETVSEEE